MTEPLERLGTDVSEALGEGPDAERLARQRARLVESAGERLAAPRRLVVVALPAAVALAAVVLLAVVWPRPAPHPSAVAPAGLVAGRAVVEGQWLHAAAGEPVDVRFSEGSLVSVEPRARLRVAVLRPEAVDVSVESGVVSSRITPRTGVRWTFLAGPYSVVVVGTRLRVSWEPDAQRLEVGVDEGRVLVLGAQLGEQGLAVSRGQQLVVSAEGARLAPSAPVELASPATPGALEAGPAAAQEPRPQPMAERTPTVEPAPSAPSAPPVPLWKQHAEAGRYREAVEEAERVGFDGLVAGLPAVDLLMLGDAARLSGSAARARQALVSVRRRFPGERPAYQAAFRLGRMSSDRSGDLAEASRWFETVIREAPPGASLVADARGRLMDALVRSGRRDAARRVAEEYLRLHPDGTYEAAARVLLEEEGRR